MEAENLERIARSPCPACGGAGGGPFGRAGSAWDDERYECPRCEGAGLVAMDDVMVQSQRPGIVKAPSTKADAPAKPDQKKRKASA